MTDATSAAPAATAPPAAPIQVRAHAAPIVTEESVKVLAPAALAIAADHFLHSQVAIAAVIAAGGVLGAVVWGCWGRLRTWRALKFLAGQVDDSVATVGKPQ